MAQPGFLNRLLERSRDPSEKTLGVLLLAPAFLLLALIVVYPIGKLVFNSFFDLRLSGGTGAKFVGLENYALVLADVPVRAIGRSGRSLEELFVELTGEGFDVAGALPHDPDRGVRQFFGGPLRAET